MQDRGKAEQKTKLPMPLNGIKIKILIFIVLVVITALFLHPLQLKIRGQMEEVRDGFISAIEESWGRKIQYRSIGPSIFGVLDIRDVKILREDNSVFLSMSRLRLSFSLLGLLRGNVYSAFKSIRIDRPVLSLDFVKDADLKKRFEAMGGNEYTGEKNTQSLRDLLPEEFSLKIWNGEWEIADSSGWLKLQGVGFDANVKQNRLSFQGRWRAFASLAGKDNGFSVFLPSASSKAFQAVMNGRVSGEYFADLKEGSAKMTIPSVQGDFFRVKPISVNFFLSDKKLEVRKVYDKSPMSFFFVYDMERDRLQGRFEGENFFPEAMLAFSGPWREYNPALAFGISGAADFKKENSSNFEFNIDFTGKGRRNTPLESAKLDVKIYGNSDRITVDTFEIRSPLGDLEFSGGAELNPPGFVPFAPYGSLSLSNFKLYGNSGISGELNLSTLGQEINIFSDNLTAGNTELSALDLSLIWEAEGVGFVASVLRFNDPLAHSYQAPIMRSLSLSGSADYSPRQIQAKINLDSFSLGDMLSFIEPFVPAAAIPAPVRSMAEDISVTTEVFITTDYEHIIYNAPHIVAAYGGFFDILASASVSGTNRGVSMSSGRVSWGQGTAEISGSLDYSNPDDIFFFIGATVRNLTYFFDGTVREKRSVSIRGSYGFQLSLSASETGTYIGFARGENMPLLSGDNFAYLSFLFSLSYDSPSFWRSVIERFELTNISTPASSSAVLRLTGAADETGLRIRNIFYDDGRGAMTGSVAANWDSSYERYRFNAELSAGSRDENYNMTGAYIDKRLELLLSVRGMQFARFTNQNAVVDGSFKLSWESIDSFEAETVILSYVLHTNDEPLRLSGNVNINNDGFAARQLRISYSGLEVGIPFFNIDRHASLIETEAWIWGLFAERPVDMALHGSAGFNASVNWMDLYQNFASLDASLIVDSARYGTMETVEPFAFLFNMSQDNLGYIMSLTGGPGDMIQSRYITRAGGGILNAVLSGPSPVRGTFAAVIDSGNIDGEATDIYVDLGALWRFIPPSLVIAFSGGIATANIKISGPLEAPNFFGTAFGTGIQMLIPEHLPEPIKPEPVTVFINETEMIFGPVNAVVGQGSGNVTAWFRFDQWIPNIFHIDIQVPSDTPIPFDLGIPGVFARGQASGKLTVAMENFILSLTGDLVANDTQISVNAGELAAMDIERSYDIPDDKVTVASNLSIRAGRRVEFFWPSVDFPIIQAYVDLGTGIQIANDMKEGRFALNGDVKLRGGEIFYLERNFYIREGTIFFKESETQFDPRISARAEIRDQADIGPVTISMIIDNAPLMSFTPRFVSTPPLSQLEIYALLGQTPQSEGEQQNLANSALASVVIDSLAQSMIINRLQRQVRDFLGLDMLSMRTQFLHNVVVQAAGGQLFGSAVDNPYRAGNYFDNTTVFIGKYFGMDLFGEAMLSFKYDETKQNWGGMVLEPEFGLEMRNPLFDIRLNVNPLHPENLFVDDISFSLLWRRSF